MQPLRDRGEEELEIAQMALQNLIDDLVLHDGRLVGDQIPESRRLLKGAAEILRDNASVGENLESFGLAARNLPAVSADQVLGNVVRRFEQDCNLPDARIDGIGIAKVSLPRPTGEPAGSPEVLFDQVELLDQVLPIEIAHPLAPRERTSRSRIPVHSARELSRSCSAKARMCREYRATSVSSGPHRSSPCSRMWAW